MFAVVHDTDHDRAGIRGDLDEVEPRFDGDGASLIERYDADLFAVSTDEPDGRETNLVIDTSFVVDASLPPFAIRAINPLKTPRI
jgi:hypothetical protein